MCLPYPHETCVAWSTVTGAGLILTIFPVLVGNLLFQRDTVDEEELKGGLVLYGGAFVCYVAAIAETYLGVLPAPLAGLVPTALVGGFVEGIGQLLALVAGPLSLMYLALGLGGLSAGITHLLVDEHV
jgi:hypothetical protein